MTKPCFDGCDGSPRICSEGDPESNCIHLKRGGTWDDCGGGGLSSCRRSDWRLFEKLWDVERDRNEAQAKVKRLQEWAARRVCDATEKYSSISKECGECVPCQARAALKESE